MLQEELRELDDTVDDLDYILQKADAVNQHLRVEKPVEKLALHLRNAHELVVEHVRHAEQTGIKRLLGYCFAIARATQLKHQLLKANTQLKKGNERLILVLGVENLAGTKRVSEQIQAVLEVQAAIGAEGADAAERLSEQIAHLRPRATKGTEQAEGKRVPSSISRGEEEGGSEPWVIDEKHLEYETTQKGKCVEPKHYLGKVQLLDPAL